MILRSTSPLSASRLNGTRQLIHVPARSAAVIIRTTCASTAIWGTITAQTAGVGDLRWIYAPCKYNPIALTDYASRLRLQHNREKLLFPCQDFIIFTMLWQQLQQPRHCRSTGIP